MESRTKMWVTCWDVYYLLLEILIANIKSKFNII